MKNILILGAFIIVILGLILVLAKPKEMSAPNVDVLTPKPAVVTAPAPTSTNTTPAPGKLKVGNFTGTLTKVDTGCFSDGECYVEVDGKHITAIIGFSQAEVGSVLGVDGFGDLEGHIGKQVEVYAMDNGDGTYTLYGSKGFYIKAL